MNTTSGTGYTDNTTGVTNTGMTNTMGATGATGHHHHAGREAAVGAVAGDEGGHFANRHGDGTSKHHPMRDAALGAGAGAETAHLRNEHGAGMNASAGKPSMGDKISGTMDKLVGQVTNNPQKVQEGAMKKGQI